MQTKIYKFDPNSNLPAIVSFGSDPTEESGCLPSEHGTHDDVDLASSINLIRSN